jgi:hypothetical protein
MLFFTVFALALTSSLAARLGHRIVGGEEAVVGE